MSEASLKAGTLKKMGDEAFKKRDFALAIKYYLGAVSMFPLFDRAWNNMGLAYREISNLNFALKCFTRAYQINENNEFAKDNMDACQKEIEENLFGVKRKKSVVEGYKEVAITEEAPSPTEPSAEQRVQPGTQETSVPWLSSQKVDEPEPAPDGPSPSPQPREEPEESLEPPALLVEDKTPEERIVIEEKPGPLGLRMIKVAKSVLLEEEEDDVTREYECPECGASLSKVDTLCPSCALEFEEGMEGGELEEKYQECEEIAEELGGRVKALHRFSDIDDDERGIFKIYRADKYLSQADWQISAGRFDDALSTFEEAKDLIETLSHKYLYPKAKEIYTSIRSEIIALDDYEDHLGALAKPLFQAERAIEKDRPNEAVVHVIHIKEYLDKLNE